MEHKPQFGPIALCTVISADIELSGAAYVDVMGMQLGPRFTLDENTATALGIASAAGAPAQMLANSAGREWLLQVEVGDAPPRDALSSYGWMAQEVLVEDVDGLAPQLEGTAFTLLRPPRELDVDNTIRACQAQGPDGEILYLTQVNGQMPGSELPENAQGVDHLFIAVLSTPDRTATIASYEAIAGTPDSSATFDTRISVVNQHRGWDLEKKHPIGTVQLAGRCLIEVDELPETAAPGDALSLGTTAIAFHAAGAAPAQAVALSDGPFAGMHAMAHRGVAGERFTLLYSASE